MPFQYVWQYQNTETTVLAQDIVDIINANNLLPFDCSQCSPGGGAVNAAGYIPVSDGLGFNNSVINTQDAVNNPTLVTEFASAPMEGIELFPLTRRYSLGSFNPLSSGEGLIYVQNDPIFGSRASIAITGGHSITVDDKLNFNGSIVNTAGSATGWYLEIRISGSDYKLALLNP